MPKELPPQYKPEEYEKALYELWEKSGYFNPDNLPPAGPGQSGAPYTIILPPPNVTGTLHVGHALMLVIQDILIRFRRMQGRRALWLPGTDHAAIATQSKVEAIIYKEENKTRHDLGREDFLKRVEAYAQESHDTIVNQMRRMGASVDWSREAYTLDEPRNLAVRTAFTRMYEAGLVYRGARMVNWDPKLQTTVSDDEVEWKEEAAPLYYLKYGPFTIATARPETKFGDKYVVMHPDDARYAQYASGQKIDLEWMNGSVTATIIKDPVIDMEFGTGVMTITPWHDATDFDIAERRGLDKEQIIDDRGLLLPIAGEFAGQHIKKARPMIVEKLREKGLLDKVDEAYTHRVATNSRGGGIIEPQIKEQWFVAVNKEFAMPHSEIEGIATGQMVTLKQLMRHVVEQKLIGIIPEHFEKTYFHWINNLRDWCISRQIWYGHRIPVWYRAGAMHVGVEGPQGDGWEQDPDTLDTWFSSGLWTFSTLGWPHPQARDLTTFHPTDVLETGYDILFFWVARMILMTTYLTGQLPFRHVFLHGLVRDKDRQKMSKSKGNIIDPLGVIDAYGTDALRFAMIFSTAAGSDIPLAEDKVKGMKHFANKVWNIARYILANVPDAAAVPEALPEGASDADKAILMQLAEARASVTGHLDNFALHEAAQTIYDFVWNQFAAVYVEASKEQLKDDAARERTQQILLGVLAQSLALLHPFMPFVTEAIWQQMRPGELLMVRRWSA